MGYVGREKLLSNGVFESQGTFVLKNTRADFTSLNHWQLVFFSSTSPIEGNTLKVSARSSIFHTIVAAYNKNIGGKM
jgi:hypothetical protein